MQKGRPGFPGRPSTEPEVFSVLPHQPPPSIFHPGPLGALTLGRDARIHDRQVHRIHARPGRETLLKAQLR
jgi:hypothetical protein